MKGNLYITAVGHRGLVLHWDDHDVFILQLTGSKHWRVWEPFIEACTYPYSIVYYCAFERLIALPHSRR